MSLNLVLSDDYLVPDFAFNSRRKTHNWLFLYSAGKSFIVFDFLQNLFRGP